MGLTIHYSMSLPGKLTVAGVKQKFGSLRQAVLDLPFQEVGETLEFRGEDECNFERRGQEDPLRWFLCQADSMIHYMYDRTGKPYPVQGWPDGAYSRSVLPSHIIGFSTYPGNGCEEANIGLSRFPRSVIVENKRNGRNHRLAVKDGGGWQWSSFCKTQYANNPDCGGLENFLRCHLSVIAMLDAAKRIGFDVKVNDEGHYWEKRDVAALVKEIGSWDKFIAGFGGALKDAAGNAGLTVESPIFERRDFETLEANGQPMLPAGWAEAVHALVKTTAAIAAQKGGN